MTWIDLTLDWTPFFACNELAVIVEIVLVDFVAKLEGAGSLVKPWKLGP
jgi:hypothetical protein